MNKKKLLAILTALATTVSLSTNVLAARVSKGSTSNSTVVKNSAKQQVPKGIQITNVTLNSDGTSVTITGRGFGNKGSVEFGGASATIIRWTGSSITVATSNVKAGDVTVTSGNGNSTTFTGEFTFPSAGTSADTVPPVVTAPNITAEATGPNGAAVTFKPTAIDNVDRSVRVICDHKSGSTFPIGTTTVKYTATDKAGNTTTGSFTVTVRNRTAPTVTWSSIPTDWSKGPVNVTFTVSDSGSGVKSVKYNDTSLTADSDGAYTISIDEEGANIKKSVEVEDNAGNAQTVTMTSGVNIDKTVPSISGAATTSPNSAGWYNTDVTVHYTASDALSGVANVTTDQTISTEGANQSVTGTATDKAGNSASATVSRINIDKTKPTASVDSDRLSNNKDLYLAITDANSVTITIVADTGTNWKGATAYTNYIHFASAIGNNKTVKFTLTDVAGNSNTYIATYDNAGNGSWTLALQK